MNGNYILLFMCINCGPFLLPNFFFTVVNPMSFHEIFTLNRFDYGLYEVSSFHISFYFERSNVELLFYSHFFFKYYFLNDSFLTQPMSTDDDALREGEWANGIIIIYFLWFSWNPNSKFRSTTNKHYLHNVLQHCCFRNLANYHIHEREKIFLYLAQDVGC